MMESEVKLPPDSAKVCKDAAAYIQERLPNGFSPKVGIISGSNSPVTLDHLNPEDERVEINLKDIPGFVKSTVVMSQANRKLLAGTISNTQVIVMLGRIHYYEGYSLKQVTLPIRVLKKLGIKTLIMVGAVASISPDIKLGDIAVISDHISLPNITGLNPLVGPNISHMGPRYPTMTDTYTYKLRKTLFKCWLKSEYLQTRGVNLKEAIYCYTSGPSYETRAECRALKICGGDVIGTCINPEIVVAKYCGLDILVVCAVTSMAPFSKETSALEAAMADLEGRKLVATKEEEDEDILSYKDNIKKSVNRGGDIRNLIIDLVSAIE
ncbi:Purine nucleoside phosphorylase [Mycoemilia scoparia]|uniref:purine-nucleoside phosphorylase n=1 Tax=Mycoemilia scoparia TaxID=417184 RepID=A0A9W8A464_9FUNG|nr:Purine nucleoside phosphorylase [Mycoemilia scoparia]